MEKALPYLTRHCHGLTEFCSRGNERWGRAEGANGELPQQVGETCVRLMLSVSWFSSGGNKDHVYAEGYYAINGEQQVVKKEGGEKGQVQSPEQRKQRWGVCNPGPDGAVVR